MAEQHPSASGPHLEISFDRQRLDLAATSRAVRESYWGGDRTDAINFRAFENSLCAGAYLDGRQVGFGRMVTDYACFAYVADVIVWPEYRGRGIGRKLIAALLDHPDLAAVPSITLRTLDAQSLYAQFGFEASSDGTFMRLQRPRRAADGTGHS